MLIKVGEEISNQKKSMFPVQKSLRENIVDCILGFSKTIVYFDFSNAPHPN